MRQAILFKEIAGSECSPAMSEFDRAGPSSFIVAASIFILLNIFIFFAPPRWNSESPLAVTIDKHARLESCKSPKIIFIGGSNVLMGLDSEAVEKALQRDVVNMGMGISLGLRYQLEEVRDEIKSGDLLVVIPEYCNFYFLSRDITNAHLNGSSDLIHVLQLNPRSWRWIWPVYSSSPSAFIDGIDDVRRFLYFKIKFYKKILVQLIHSPKKVCSKDLFKPASSVFTNRHEVNLYGDFIAPANLRTPPLSTAEPIQLGDYKKFNTEATDLLNEFQAYAQSKGATLVVLPPVFPGHLKCEAIIMDIYGHWMKLLKIPVLASPERYAFNWSELLDSEYHTNAKGRQRRTAMVIEDLSRYLNNSQLPLPSSKDGVR